MNKDKAKQIAAAVSLVAILGIVGQITVQRFTQPTLTDTQLFLLFATSWRLPVILLALTALFSIAATERNTP